MFEKVNEAVNVLVGFSTTKAGVRVLPYLIDWRGKRYKLEVMGLHHPARRGTDFLHIFEFSSGNTKFKLELNTETLEWNLAEVYHDYSA
jgi:hypothetical protein